MKTIQFKLNGEARRVDAWPDQLFIEVLRETFKIKSVKAGCSPQRECGSCLMLLDGQPKLACAVRAEQVQGRSVLTLEGVSDTERRLYADAFQAAAGLQCGFCTPGLALRIKWMTDQGERLSRADIARLLDGHLCRCTGYKKIVDAVELIQEAKFGGGALPAIVEDGGVGASLRRYQSAELALGERPFVADIDAPGLLYGAVVLSAHARARIARIDVSKARALPGVAAVATAADVPGDRWVGQIIADWPVFVAEGEEARCVGDVLAAVAADTPRLAREAAALVAVDYEPLPPVLDPAEAIRPGAPQVNPRHDNVLSVTRYARGDVEAALAASAHVVRDTWTTQRIEHLFLEPEACLARPLPDGRLHVTSQGQGIFDDRRQIASVLGEPEERLFVELVPNGGAFGGKEDMSIQAQTALLARLTGRPVRIELSREESIRMHPKRHPITMSYTVGCDADGRLTAAKIDILGDSGAYASVGGKVLERAAGHACGPYRMPRARHRGDRRLHQQSAVRRDARLRRQPDELRHRGLPRPARREGRPRRLGDALAQHRAGRRPDDDRTGAREVGRRREDAARGEAGLRRGARQRARGRHRLRAQELRHRQRRDRMGKVPPGGRARRRRRALQRLHRDGPGAADGPHPVRGRGHRPARGRVPAPGQQPLRARLRPDHRLARHPARRARRDRRGGEAEGRPRRRANALRPRRQRSTPATC